VLANPCLGTFVAVDDETTRISYDITSVKLDELHPAVTATAILVRCPIADLHKRVVLDLQIVDSHVENPSLAEFDGLVMENAAQEIV